MIPTLQLQNSPRILIINHYLYDKESKIEKLEKAIRNLSEQKFSIHTLPFQDLSESNLAFADGLILSGRDSRGKDSSAKKNLVGLYANEKKLLDAFPGPVLGICFGSQILSQSHGERLVSIGKHKGWSMVQLSKKSVDPMLFGLPDEFQVFEAHTLAIRQPPLNFVVLAQTIEGEAQLIRHIVLPHYGAQFHPESDSEKENAGALLLANFLKMTQN